LEEDFKKTDENAEQSAATPADETVETAETDAVTLLKYKDKKEVLKGGILGAFIGLAVIVPGVSGSVVAMILGLYEKLLYALGNFIKKFKYCILFLLPVLIGAIIGFVGGFFGVRELINLFPFAIVALFAGLMLGAYPAVGKELKGQKITTVRCVLFAVGFILPIAFGVIATLVSPGQMDLGNLKFYHYILFVVLGYLMSVTQLVPGLSATALLMMCGCYRSIMDSVSLTTWQNNPMVIFVYVCLAAGFVLGLFTVSKGIIKLFEKLRTPTYFVLCGLSLGSIVSMFFNPEIYETYTAWGADGVNVAELIVGIVLLILGAALAFMFVRYERKKTGK